MRSCQHRHGSYATFLSQDERKVPRAPPEEILSFFDGLRHTGNQLTADAGANLRELMERMGHSSSRAAPIYLHSTSERQRQLAENVAVRVQSELSKPDKTETNRVACVWHDSENTDGQTR